MKIYLGNGKTREQAVYVTPGAFEEGSDFFDSITKTPIQFRVVFNYGVAEVLDSVGKFMIDKGFARKSKVMTSKVSGFFDKKQRVAFA